MMILRILLMVVSMVSISCQTTDKTHAGLSRQTTNPADASLRRRERELAACLRWEILWNDAPLGFRVPEGGTARLAAYQTGDNFWYCSRDLRVCAQYRLDERQLGQRINSIKCSGEQDDMSSVLKFAGQPPNQPLTSGQRVGGLASSSGILWTPTLELNTREAMVKQYKQLRPTELEGLRDWLRTSHQNTGYRSITIACFASSDPEVYIYGDRPAERRGPIVFSVFWDKEREEWLEAWILEVAVLRERGQGTERFEELKAMIQAIACDTIRFN